MHSSDGVDLLGEISVLPKSLDPSGKTGVLFHHCPSRPPDTRSFGYPLRVGAERLLPTDRACSRRESSVVSQLASTSRGNPQLVISFTCPFNLDSLLSRSATFKPLVCSGSKHMKQFIALFVAAIALVVLPTIAAADCPKGYVPCGERNQLCCPGK